MVECLSGWHNLKLIQNWIIELESLQKQKVSSLHGKQNKKDVINSKIKDYLEQIENLKELCELENKAVFYYFWGKIYNLREEYNKNAEDLFSRAIKFNPKLVDAWNELGECFWRKGDYKAAKLCFESALKYSTNKVSLRNLSIILRQNESDINQFAKNIEDSLQKAKAAVDLDVKDGISWSILGNAYISLFFNVKNDPDFLRKCLDAYLEAEKDDRANQDADLHYNKAMAIRYEEDYVQALEELKIAINLEPDWDAPLNQLNILKSYLKRINNSIISKGKLKTKRLNQLVNSINLSHLGPYKGGQFVSPGGTTVKLILKSFNNLQKGINRETVILGKVICQVFGDDMPFTFCLCDQEQQIICITLYNLANGKGVIIGDSVAIPEPYFRPVCVNVDDEVIQFPLVRVENPLVLVVNGSKLTQEYVAYLQLQSLTHLD